MCAHLGLVDHEGIGRREMVMTCEEVAVGILYQAGALQALLAVEGMPTSQLNLNDMEFGMGQKDENVANGVLNIPISARGALVGSCGFAGQEQSPNSVGRTGL